MFNCSVKQNLESLSKNKCFYSGQVMELHSERDRGCGYRFKWESGAQHFWKMAWISVSRSPSFCHLYLESEWVKKDSQEISATMVLFKDTMVNAVCHVFACRSHASGAGAVLRFHPVCSGAEWTGLLLKTTAAPHRHAFQAGPEVGTLLIPVYWAESERDHYPLVFLSCFF